MHISSSSVLEVSVDASDASSESEMKYYSKVIVDQGLYDHEVKFTYQFFFVMFLSKKRYYMTLLLFKINVVLMCY